MKNQATKPKTAFGSRFRQARLMLLILITVLLQGCLFDRLISLKSQACAFDEHFNIEIDQHVEIVFNTPVLLKKDMHLLWGAAATAESDSITGSNMSYLFERVSNGVENQKAPMFETFNIDFEFVVIDQQPRLSKIKSSEIPAELLATAAAINLTGLDEMTDAACHTKFNPLTRSVAVPIDNRWFSDVPTRSELIEFLGAPLFYKEEGNGLVYQYRLVSETEDFMATLVTWYDETGDQALMVDVSFGRYHIQADLLASIAEIRFSI